MDILSIIGVLLAVAAIFGGQILEGGGFASLLQLTAFVIVIGGTIGAVLLSFPKADLLKALVLGKTVFSYTAIDVGHLVEELVSMASLARRDGVLALEGRLQSMHDPFLKRAIGFVVDGVDTTFARSTLEAHIEAEAEENRVGARVYEAAGGFAPTLGILGAVLGLIQVMEQLASPEDIGPGIAIAFVATVYGVGVANLFFLPMANKIKRRIILEKERKVLIAEGVLAIQEGLNPRVLEEKLHALTGSYSKREAGSKVYFKAA